MATAVLLGLACGHRMDPRQQAYEGKTNSQRPRFEAETPANPLASMIESVQHGLFLYVCRLFSLGNCDGNLLLVAALRALPLQRVGLVSGRRIDFKFSLEAALGTLDRDLRLLLAALDEGCPCCGKLGRTGLLLFLLRLGGCGAAGFLSRAEQGRCCCEGEYFTNE
jgi:hypothetical protein